ncbi:N-acetylglucosamine kinase [Priestia megaterium]|uniref:N-acetylglucosamine kinase n=1 Tax=Priestia megaterium TaxID=1404 RepID=A0A6H1NW75_PRIMG|nr:BadF/BadG/BcrA/BcrD ATPase family protein [Priestia megaterium]QIZ05550.1 N-acetylglucosamine kinase [Priestia megaterium]
MSNRLIIGMDGGGTKTRVIVKERPDGETLFDQNFGMSNYNNIGVEGLRPVFRDIYEALVSCFQERLHDAILVLGSAGVDRPKDVEIYLSALKESGFTCQLEVLNDAEIALVGSSGARKDALMIAGTGSIVVGIDSKGKIVRSGGWGGLISDEGSGFQIGRHAIAAVMQEYDKVIAPTSFTEKLLAHFQLTSPEEFIDLLYLEDTIPVDKVASCTPIILEAWAKGDVAARTIVAAELEKLVRLVVGISRQMGSEKFRLSVAGSLLTKSTDYFDSLKEKLSMVLPQVEISAPLYDPVFGAIIIGAQYK